MTFGYKISPNIWYRFDGCQRRKLLLCREPGFGSQALQELLDVPQQELLH